MNNTNECKDCFYYYEPDYLDKVGICINKKSWFYGGLSKNKCQYFKEGETVVVKTEPTVTSKSVSLV